MSKVALEFKVSPKKAKLESKVTKSSSIKSEKSWEAELRPAMTKDSKKDESTLVSNTSVTKKRISKNSPKKKSSSNKNIKGVKWKKDDIERVVTTAHK